MEHITMRVAIAAITLSILATPALAQSHASPYAVFADRNVKALSGQQISDLRAGRGMGLALPAELNGYPGPSHALELADKLQLTATQREGMQRLFTQMKADAIPLGEQLIAQESELDRQFSKRTVTAASLEASVNRTGATQAALRHAHLKYHLATLEVLTPSQVADYQRLRGYASPAGHGGHQRKH
jgi:Spy/CpxP family protein refolding chaperone